MFFDDHAPPPIFMLNTANLNAPKRVKSMVLEWTALHQEELLRDWDFCKNMETPFNIEPLD
jgi:hypothetical protein